MRNSICCQRLRSSALASTVPAIAVTETVLYSLQGGSDGAGPIAALLNVAGTLYGTTSSGGSSGAGTVFSLTPPTIAGGNWTETVLYNFAGGSDGKAPQSKLINIKGVLYGTTTAGGGTGCGGSGCGTVFRLTPPAVAGGTWTETVLYSFQGGSDGANASSGLIHLGGKFYGTTRDGGGTSCVHTRLPPGCGTVFKLSPPARGQTNWTESVLYRFQAGNDGADPIGGLINVKGTLYGTTNSAGDSDVGTAFSLTPPAVAGGAWTETVLYAFSGGSDGSHPDAELLNIKGVLYSTSARGGGAGCGGDGCGTVFNLVPPAVAGGNWTETVLYSFAGGSDGTWPQAGLISFGSQALRHNCFWWISRGL